ncbi:MAG: DUF2520 domain-containing protein [Bacteroidia bacterium]|nr:DUF2520 domain-containing protein [Bacteroidia bacterium]
MLKIFFIGSGKLNQNFANAFSKTDVEMVGVYSATVNNSLYFSKKFNISQFKDIKDIPTNCDVYFLGVNDSQISIVSQELKVNGIVIHCSGFLSKNLVSNHKNNGVFWPIQSLSKEHYANFSNVPICIEASDDFSLRILETLADKISKRPLFIDEQKRKILHVSAVFANNFTNHLFVLINEFLNGNHLEFDILMPIIQETSQKLTYLNPKLAQTGPASRNDLNTMAQHQSILSKYPELLDIYKILSKSISEHQKQ